MTAPCEDVLPAEPSSARGHEVEELVMTVAVT